MLVVLVVAAVISPGGQPCEPGGASRSLEKPGRARKSFSSQGSLEKPGGASRSLEKPGGAWRSQGEPAGAWRSQGEPGEARGSQGGPGGAMVFPMALQSQDLISNCQGSQGEPGGSQEELLVLWHLALAVISHKCGGKLSPLKCSFFAKWSSTGPPLGRDNFGLVSKGN